MNMSIYQKMIDAFFMPAFKELMYMGILQGLFRSRDKPQNRTAGSGYSFFFGGTTSGKAVTERSAMQMTAVYACVRILSEAIAGLPLHLYRYKENGGKEKAVDHPLYLLLHDEPNPEMSSFVFPPVFVFILLYHILHICVYFFSIAPPCLIRRIKALQMFL